MSVNRVTLIGNLGKDVDLRYTPSGAAVANFSMATTERFKDKAGDRQEKVEWHNVVVWGSLAEICGKYLHKGKQIYLEGKIQTRSYDDKDGAKKYITEIVGSQMHMLGSKSEGHGGQGDSQGGHYQGNQGNQGRTSAPSQPQTSAPSQPQRAAPNKPQNSGYGGPPTGYAPQGGAQNQPQQSAPPQSHFEEPTYEDDDLIPF